MLSKEEQLAADERFRQLCKIYYAEPFDSKNEKDAWEEMYGLVLNACSAAVKKKLKNIYREDIDEVILDSTINVMEMLRKKKRKKEEVVLRNKLVTLCGPYTLYPLYSKQKRFEEDVLSFDDFLKSNVNKMKI